MEQLELPLTRVYRIAVALGGGQVQHFEVRAMNFAEAFGYVRAEFPSQPICLVGVEE